MFTAGANNSSRSKWRLSVTRTIGALWRIVFTFSNSHQWMFGSPAELRRIPSKAQILCIAEKPKTAGARDRRFLPKLPKRFCCASVVFGNC